MSGKKGLSVSIDSDLSVKEKGRKKDEIRKNSTTKQIEASNQAKNNHRQHFQENTSTISKNPIPTNQVAILLTQTNQVELKHVHLSVRIASAAR